MRLLSVSAWTSGHNTPLIADRLGPLNHEPLCVTEWVVIYGYVS